MVAIIFMSGTEYDCNHDNNGDLICLQYRLERGLNMLAMSEIVPESRNYDFWTNLAKTKFW